MGGDLVMLKGDADRANGSVVLGGSGVWGVGTKTVFLTSRRPRFTGALRGVATCCACYGKVSI